MGAVGAMCPGTQCGRECAPVTPTITCYGTVHMPLKLHLIKCQHRHENSMQQICIEIIQHVGKWIFRKMAKSALAFYKRCKMDLLKSRTKLCGFQALLRYEDDSCNEFEEKKSMRQNYGQNIAPLWRQTKSVHKETDVLNMNFQRFLRTIFEILKMTLKMKTEFSKMLFWKCDFS